MKNIVILNGSNSNTGDTAALISAFTAGAQGSGNKVVKFDTAHMDINGCLGCMRCGTAMKDERHICVQVDEMEQIYGAVMKADVIVLASPVYWWGPTGQLKLAVDRLQAVIGHAGLDFLAEKDTALLMTYRGGGKQSVLAWYSIFRQVVGCRDLGTVISRGQGDIDEARRLDRRSDEIE